MLLRCRYGVHKPAHEGSLKLGLMLTLNVSPLGNFAETPPILQGYDPSQGTLVIMLGLLATDPSDRQTSPE